MPKSEMKQESEYMIPEETPVPARLDSVEVKEFQSKDRQTKQYLVDPKTGDPVMYKKWKWTFHVVDGPYAGVNVSQMTVPYISTRADNVVRQWAETLTGKQWGEAEGIDTDALVGLRCLLTVKHQAPRPKQNGDGMWYGLDVGDLFPADALADSPPF
jgi:hypothetical protein